MVIHLGTRNRKSFGKTLNAQGKRDCNSVCTFGLAGTTFQTIEEIGETFDLTQGKSPSNKGKGY